MLALEKKKDPSQGIFLAGVMWWCTSRVMVSAAVMELQGVGLTRNTKLS